MKNYLFFDIEYANSKNKSICQMGLMIEDKESHEPTYPEREILVNPDDEFDNNCMSVHHINKEKVKNEKTFKEIWPEIEKYFINSVVIGHNIASSDLDGLCKNLTRYDLSIPELYYIDTLEIARDFVSPLQIKDYSLGTLCEYFDIDLDEAHNAFDDACVCSDLLNALIDNYNVNINKYVKHYLYDSNYSFSPYINNLAVTREINILLGALEGMMADGIISSGEISNLKEWFENNQKLEGNKYGKTIINVLKDILSDGIVTFEEVVLLKNTLLEITQYLSSSVETKSTQLLQGMINGITADKTLDDAEIYSIQKWVYDNQYLIGHYPYDRIKEEIDKVLEDKIVTELEKKEMISLFNEIFNPVAEAISKSIIFEENEFCLSGDFEHGTKKDIEAYIVSKGGIVHDGVRKKTNYVVVGGLGSNSYSNGNYGTKVKKAMELGITVITEKQLFDEI